MRRRRASWLIRPGSILAAILLAATAAFTPAVLAGNGPGNNGTVKIHSGNTENDAGVVRNEPHVCTFHLHFYFADPTQSGAWRIEAWPPTGDRGTVVASGTYDTAGDGQDRQPTDGVLTLADGHYKLFWDGGNGHHDKMKTFWVACAVPSASAPGEPSAPANASTEPAESAAPSGNELPIEGSAPPSGEVEGIVGTPPPTDTAGLVAAPSDQGWRVVLLVLSGILAMIGFLAPSSPIRWRDRSAGRCR